VQRTVTFVAKIPKIKVEGAAYRNIWCTFAQNLNMLEIVSPSHLLPTELPKGFVLLIDKPLGWTSFDVVNTVRHFLSKRVGAKRIKLGHAGTLDPLATGLLVLCAGDYTKRIDEFQGQEKEYTGTITFGAVTASFDLEKPIEIVQNPVVLTPATLEAARLTQLGEIDQVPPIFSAVKLDGKRLYTNARSGTEVAIKSRKVMVSEFSLTQPLLMNPENGRPEVVNLSKKRNPIWYYPDYHSGLQSNFKIICGKGTYIRSMVFDMGELTGCGAYLSALRRTRIGDFSVTDAWDVETLIQLLKDATPNDESPST
jgi:tRNA pseudouridine55 synthase